MKKNIFVFDESIIGCNPALPLVMGEVKELTGGKNNVILTTEPGLGSVIPFSMTDGSTSFIVFILGPRSYTNLRIPSFGCTQRRRKGIQTLLIEFFYAVRVDISQLICSVVLWMSSLTGGHRLIQVRSVTSYVITSSFTATRRLLQPRREKVSIFCISCLGLHIGSRCMINNISLYSKKKNHG